MNPEYLLLGFPDYVGPGQRLADRLGIDYQEIEIHRFPDGESRLRLPSELPQTVIFCRPLDHPNEKLVELLLASEGARKLGAQCLILVAPYLCYMRQDKAFHPGEVVSQHIIGQQLAGQFDVLLTVDAHLHRVHRLSDAVPTSKSINITATRPMARFLEQQLDKPMLIGPDEESEQWVAAIANHEGLDYRVARKQRFGDREVWVTLPEADYEGRDLVLVDDVVSTGHTLAAAAQVLLPYRPASISALVTHALFAGDALDQLQAAGVDNIWSCDSIPHPTNRVPLDSLLGDCLSEAFHIEA
jgi:ribose-phosphate pyrophosphokinase